MIIEPERRAQSLYCAIPATGRPTPSTEACLRKRRNKAIAPYGPDLRPGTKASFALTGTGSKSNGSSHGSRRRSRSRQGPAGVTLHHEFGLKALDITID